MKVHELMNAEVATCRPDANLAEAAAIMWDRDCGFVPVVDEKDHPIGALTDRDIAIALGTRNVLASELRVQDIMSRRVHACALEDDLDVALGLMAADRIRRVMVIDRHGRLEGVLAMNDVILARTIPEAAVLSTLRSISEHRRKLEAAL